MAEKVIHEIRLNQYSAVPADRTRRFSLGTKDSYGIEQLRIVPGEGWDGLTITATFHPPEGEAVQVLVPADGLIDVPPEATRSGSELPLKYGKIVFAGVADGMQRISCNLPYTVLDHAPVEGAESSGPAPSWYEQAAAHFLPGGGKAGQVLAKASDADLDVEWADGGGSGTSDHAKLSNRDAADQHPISAITGLQKELDGKQPAGNYLTADSLQAATDAALEQAKATGEFDGANGHPGENGADGYSPTANVTQNENGATITITDKNGTTTATVTDGKDGADGIPGKDGATGRDGITPTIGENGNWYLGDTDTGKPSRGETGPKGEKGEKGGTTLPELVDDITISEEGVISIELAIDLTACKEARFYISVPASGLGATKNYYFATNNVPSAYNQSWLSSYANIATGSVIHYKAITDKLGEFACATGMQCANIDAYDSTGGSGTLTVLKAPRTVSEISKLIWLDSTTSFPVGTRITSYTWR